MSDTTAFLRNTWYVAAQSSAIDHALCAQTLLGENLLFYRDSKGTPVALEDACPHRKLPLSMGKLVGDTVQCGYHGLTFDCHGTCVAAPTQDRLPVDAKVKSFPVVERYGLLWIWMGDVEKADESLIIDIEDYDKTDWGRTDGGMLEVECHYLYLIDNLLDPSHVAWVHESSFAASGTESTPLQIDETDSGVIVSRWIRDQLPPPYYADKVGFAGNADRLQHYEVRLPSIAVNIGMYTPAGKGGHEGSLPADTYKMRSYHFMTPVSQTRTRYHWFQHYNTDPNNEAVREQLNQGARTAFEEDRVVLEAVQSGIDNANSRPINLMLDKGAQIFRNKLARHIAAENGN
ncbi:MAG: aromatic ring-hydroxylating dioxygenase subunit alpha [Pseudomonadota bacterium]